MWNCGLAIAFYRVLDTFYDDLLRSRSQERKLKTVYILLSGTR